MSEEYSSDGSYDSLEYEKDSSIENFEQDCSRYIEILGSRQYDNLEAEIVEDDRMSVSWFTHNGFRQPFLIKNAKTLGLFVPPSTFGVDYLVELIGADFPLSVNVEWRNYFCINTSRDRILDVDRLEFSNTLLARKVHSPKFVKELGWTQTVWPKERREIGDFPQTELFCLMSVTGSYKDFRINFGGSSLWCQLFQGKKVFYLIPPTEENLHAYESWMLSKDEKKNFFGDLVEKCYILELTTNEIFVVPSGWIFAVYSPEDSIGFSGSFLHNLSIPMQLKVFKIENSINTPLSEQYPRFMSVTWHAAAQLLTKLRANPSSLGMNKLSSWEYDSLEYLVKTLQEWNTMMKSRGANLDDAEQEAKASAYMAAQAVDCSGPQQLMDELEELATKSTSIKLDKRKLLTAVTAAEIEKEVNDDDESNMSSLESSSVGGDEKPIKSSGDLKLRFKARNVPLTQHDIKKDILITEISSKINQAALLEDSWLMKCICGATGENYDDGLRMVACDSCEVWQHTMCSGIPDGVDPPDSFLCNSCKTPKIIVDEEWHVKCICGVSAKNYDDGWRMVACESCNTWQHTICAGIPHEKEPPSDYKCTSCKQLKKQKSSSKKGVKRKNLTTKKQNESLKASKKSSLEDCEGVNEVIDQSALSEDWTEEEGTVGSPEYDLEERSPTKSKRRKRVSSQSKTISSKTANTNKLKAKSPILTPSPKAISTPGTNSVTWPSANSIKKRKTKPQTVRQRLCRKLGTSSSFRR